MPDEEPRKAIGASETGDKIDRIRDILLGGSLEEFGTRLGHVENLVQALDSSLRE
jgi:hypothetical protein